MLIRLDIFGFCKDINTESDTPDDEYRLPAVKPLAEIMHVLEGEEYPKEASVTILTFRPVGVDKGVPVYRYAGMKRF